MSGTIILLVILMGMFVAISIMVYMKQSKDYQRSQDRIIQIRQEKQYYENQYCHLLLTYEGELKRNKEEFTRKFQNNLSVGDIFQVPNDMGFVLDFRNTTQVITEINFEDGIYKSRSLTDDGNTTIWTNHFHQIGKYTWVKSKQNDTMKHKFL